MPGHNGGANWGSGAVDPVRGEFYVVSKNMPVMLRLVRSDDEPTAGGALGGGPGAANHHDGAEGKLIAEAKEAAAKGPIRYTSPYDFMLSPTNAMTAIGPPWSHITGYDLNTGDIKWRVPHGGVMAPPGAASRRTPGRTCPAVVRWSRPEGWCSWPRRPTARSVPTTVIRARWCGAPICRRGRRVCRPPTR